MGDRQKNVKIIQSNVTGNACLWLDHVTYECREQCHPVDTRCWQHMEHCLACHMLLVVVLLHVLFMRLCDMNCVQCKFHDLDCSTIDR
jgi:hypothetical protein